MSQAAFSASVLPPGKISRTLPQSVGKTQDSKHIIDSWTIVQSSLAMHWVAQVLTQIVPPCNVSQDL